MANAKTENTRQKIVTPEGRLSFPVLYTPRAQGSGQDQGAPKWSTTLLIAKSSPEIAGFLATMRAACAAAIEREWPDPAKRPLKLRMPLKDGDTAECESGENAGRLRRDVDPNVSGCWILSSSRATKRKKDGAAITPPAVIDRRGLVISDPSKIYGGAWARLEISCYPYANVNYGVGAWLDSVLFVRDGEPFAGESDPRRSFGAYLDPNAPAVVGGGAQCATENRCGTSAPRPLADMEMFG